MITDDGPVRIEVPRDREGSFEPQLIGKHERRFTGFDQKIVAMYARGMTVREIQGYLPEMYGTEVSPELISKVTDEVHGRGHGLAEPAARADVSGGVLRCAAGEDPRRSAWCATRRCTWRSACCPTAARRAGAVDRADRRARSSGSRSFNELEDRGVEDILIAVVDGLKGFPEAIEAAFPATTVQTCIVHLIRNSLDYATWKDRKAVAAALRPIYTRRHARPAPQAALEAFAAGPWGAKYPTIVRVWRRAWEHVIPFFAFPPEVRRVIYTTNAIESLHMQLRKIIKTRGHFPSDEAATKLLWLALRNVMAQIGKIGPRVEGGDESVRHPVRRSIHELTSVKPASHTEFLTGPMKPT